MGTTAIKLVQSKLKDMGYYTGRIDGDRGLKTHAAVKKGLPRSGQRPCPWSLKIAWNKSQRRSDVRVRTKVADSLGGRVYAQYGLAEIKRLGFDLFGGNHNPRKMRGGSGWSTHSWGIAIDFNPERNRLKWGRGRAGHRWAA